ncbi:hypothetical protein LCGC14_1633540 [marine sediment metagenome]|uniref:Uncharacterized protein n=1 Tax=marine sediment metagenome TaxID=412755 RepID=A0A0F9IP70_9ZZZZ
MSKPINIAKGRRLSKEALQGSWQDGYWPGGSDVYG